MTHHDDSMRLLRIQRSNHSNKPRQPQDHMAHQDLWRGLGRPTICNNRQRQPNHRVAPVTMRNSCTTFRRACNTRRAQTCLQIKCSTVRNTNHKSRDSRRSHTSSMAPVSCMACNRANHKPNNPTTKDRPSDSHGLALHLRHYPPSLAKHQRHITTTLQDKMYQLARRPPSSRHLKSPLSIRRLHTPNLAHRHSNHIRCSILRSRPRIRHIISNILRLNSLSSSRQMSLTMRSNNTRHRYKPSSGELKKATCKRLRNF